MLPQENVFLTRAKVNREAGSRRMLAHYTITPGQPGWLEGIDRAIEVNKPDGWKGYTIGDVILAHEGRYAYRLDDERLMYPFYEKAAKAGIRTVCIHKGLFPRLMEERVPRLAPHAAVGDVGRAAKDWPQLNFAIYHSGYRHLGGPLADASREWEQSGRLSWLSDLAEIPGKYGVTNVYGDLGAIFAWTVIAQPQLAAAMLGTLIKGLGADHVIWAPTRCGPGRHNGRSRRCAGSRFRRRCKSGTACAAWPGGRQDQERDCRRKRPATLWLRQAGRVGQSRSPRRHEGALRKRRDIANQPALRVHQQSRVGGARYARSSCGLIPAGSLSVPGLFFSFRLVLSPSESRSCSSSGKRS